MNLKIRVLQKMGTLGLQFKVGKKAAQEVGMELEHGFDYGHGYGNPANQFEEECQASDEQLIGHKTMSLIREVRES